MVISPVSWTACSNAWQSFHEKMLPNIQLTPSLVQLGVISSCPTSCYMGDETNPHRAITSLQVVAKSNKVSESSVITSISSLNTLGWIPSRPINLYVSTWCRMSLTISLGLWDPRSAPPPCLPAQRAGYTAIRYCPQCEILNRLCILNLISSTPHLQR